MIKITLRFTFRSLWIDFLKRVWLTAYFLRSMGQKINIS